MLRVAFKREGAGNREMCMKERRKVRRKRTNAYEIKLYKNVYTLINDH